MGKKLDKLLGRAFKPSKLKSHITLAISRLAVFKNQRQARCNQARSDVVQLLQLGHHDRALLRVEQVMKEQNTLDVFVMLEGYCTLVIERLHLIEQERSVCPEELKEAISGLLFASSRCGDFPELQEIRAVFTSLYGKEFAARAIELRNNCGVNTKMVQKLSTRQPDLQSRRNVLKEIAAENGIAIQMEETSASSEENLDVSKVQSQANPETSSASAKAAGGIDGGEFSDSSMKARKKYRDVADAAQAAFESAAHAAAAARAAVELSRSDSHDPDDDHKSPKDSQPKRMSDTQDKEPEIKISCPSSSSEDSSVEGNLDIRTMSLDEVDPVKLLEKEVVIPNSDDDNDDISHGSSFDQKTRKLKDKDDDDDEVMMFQYSSQKQIPSSLRAGLKAENGPENPTAHGGESSGLKGKQHFAVNKEPNSVRTRQVRGY